MLETTIDNRFRLKERVLQQGELDIYDAIDQTMGQSVWVKVWNAPLPQDAAFAENWRGQLISLQGIDDGHLPRIIAFGRTVDGSLYQVEDVPAGTLLRRWVSRRAPLSVADSTELMATVAQAVAVAHREGVAHGGLNPENIYIEEGADEKADAYITHWELGEAVVALRHAGNVIPDRLSRYLAPEQTNEKARPAAPTPTADVYALGVMLYELLTGTLPTQGEGAVPTITAPRRFNPEIPVGVENLLMRALSYDPALRQPNAHSFANGILQALHNPEPVIPVAPPVVPTVIVERRSTFPWRGLGLLTLGALLAVLSISIWLRGQQVVPSGSITPTPNTIPILVGASYNQAVRGAWLQGYTVTINRFIEDPTRPAGVILQQCPGAGQPRGTVCTDPSIAIAVLEQDTIVVDVNPLPVPEVSRLVPDLYGQTEDVARQVLEEGNLRLGTRREAFDNLLPAGRIVEQNPRRSVPVPAGTTIDIIISAGLPPTTGDAPLLPTATATPEVSSSIPSNGTSDSSLLAPTPAITTQDEVASQDNRPATTLPDDNLDISVVVLDEPFDDGTALSWTQASSEQQDGAIRNGTYEMRISEARYFWKSQPNALFTDFRVTGTVVLSGTSGSPDSGAGLIFRATSDQAFYYFEANGAQAFRLRAQNAGQWIDLLNWTPSTALLPEGFPNVLTVDAVGERITLYINGQQVAALDVPPEASYLSGDIGVAAQAGDVTSLLATFDSIQVGQLQ